MRRLVTMILCAGLGWVGAGLAAQPAFAETLCVGGKNPGCFATVQGAVDAAHDGDTIEIGPGTFAGGITIDKSLQIVGTSAGATIIEGGGPVITIGEFFGTSRPTVSISRVTITGGLNNSLPDSSVTAGGGVWIPQAAGNTTGATVTISDSVITRNRVGPTTTIPPGPFCGPLACAFAGSGGIDNSGTLTVVNTRISDNEVGSPPSVASGAGSGGIGNHPQGTLTLRRSFVTGNQVRANAPNGRFAAGGGIGDSGALTIENSVVSGNTVEVAAAFSGEATSFTGGIEVTGDASATITGTTVSGNSVRATNAGGSVLAGVGGISTDEDVSLVLRDSTVDHNSVEASVSVAGANAIAFAGGLEIEGTVAVSASRFIGNELRAEAPAGLAGAAGGGIQAASLEPVLISESLVAQNSVSSLTTSGIALALGGGVVNGGLLTLRRTRIVANTASAEGSAGFAHGGGIQNWVVPLPGFPQVLELTLVDSVVTGNRLSASPGIPSEGGGILTTAPMTLTSTVVAGNHPDQCFGC